MEYMIHNNCKYLKAIPHGSGGLLDSDTLYGLARDLAGEAIEENSCEIWCSSWTQITLNSGRASLQLDTFLREILGAVVLAGNFSKLDPTFRVKPIKVLAEGVESEDGRIVIDEKQGRLVKIMEKVDLGAYLRSFHRAAAQQGTICCHK
ncbi:hypothetical protein NC652_022009 [Populus alba x Populus x berolinensis]|nr:hypothetical protein NC652_022009 [Populus alba x Populus x berolinensis]